VALLYHSDVTVHFNKRAHTWASAQYQPMLLLAMFCVKQKQLVSPAPAASCELSLIPIAGLVVTL
jgi:hypothetical protein